MTNRYYDGINPPLLWRHLYFYYNVTNRYYDVTNRYYDVTNRHFDVTNRYYDVTYRYYDVINPVTIYDVTRRL